MRMMSMALVVSFALGAAVLTAGEKAGKPPVKREKPEDPEPKAEAPKDPDADGPKGDTSAMVLDESAPRWFVDRFAGNTTSGGYLLQGPAREAGGLTRPYIAAAPDGSVYLSTDDQIVKVLPDGTLRLLAGGGSKVGDCPAWQAAIRTESMAYSPADQSLYFVHRTIPCVRRLFQKDGQWQVALVAGNATETGSKDGAAGDARFQEPRSIVANSKGSLYVLDDINCLRKIEGGQVSTVAKFKGEKQIVDGPLAGASMGITRMSGHICLGENDDTLYVADHWHFAARRIDLKAGTISTVMKDSGLKIKNADGPALTRATVVSGLAFVQWDPVHKALWCDGPDATRLRWVRDGKMLTVLGYGGNWDRNGTGLPGKDVKVVWAHVRAVDAQGRAYFIDGGSKTGVWRAYEKGGAQ